ncbi:MAG: DUF973 family protein [Thermoplasmata archaeon]
MGSALVSPDELRGLSLARAAAVTSLVSLVIAFLAPVSIILATGIEIHYGGFHVGSGSFSNSVFEELVVVVVVGFLVALIAIVLYILSFSALRKVQANFGGPRALLIVGVIGTLLVFVGLAEVLQQFLMATNCVGANGPTSCVALSSLYGAVLAIFFGFILAIVGWIGLVIGLYRIGKRYDSTITKVGAILTIIPVLTVIAPILILVGISASLHRLRARARAS